jgi:hypothetical protein
MKPIVIILAAVAVLSGCSRQLSERDRVKWLEVKAKADQVAAQHLENLEVGKATRDQVEHFRDFVKTTREILARPEFPREFAPSVRGRLEDALSEYRRRLTVHRDTAELAKLLDGL